RFHVSERDYVRAGILYARTSGRVRAVLALGLAVLLALAVWGPDGLRSLAIGGALGGVLGVGAIRLVNPWLLRRHYRQYKGIQQEQTVALLDEGVRFTSADGQGRLPWDKILKWRCNGDYVLVYPMPRLYYLVPVAAVAAQGFDVDRLKAALARHVGP